LLDAQNAFHRLQFKLQHDMPKKSQLDSECFCFDESSEWRFELAAEVLQWYLLEWRA
jgi:hypothetical protein